MLGREAVVVFVIVIVVLVVKDATEWKGVCVYTNHNSSKYLAYLSALKEVGGRVLVSSTTIEPGTTDSYFGFEVLLFRIF